MWCDEYYDDDRNHGWYDKYHFFEWCYDYKKRKAQKASIKEELLSIVWHPSRYWHWSVPEDEKEK